MLYAEIHEPYFHASDQVVVFNTTLLEQKELSFLIYLGSYWVAYSAFCRIGLSTINILGFYITHTSGNRGLLNCNQCVRNLPTGNKILMYNSAREILLCIYT